MTMCFFERKNVFGVTPIIVEPPHKLSFNQAFLSAIHSQDNYGEDDSPAAMEQYKFYLRSLFTHNQFGDYLDFIEMEKAAAENLRDAKQGIEEIHQQIKEIFNEFGDTISDDFDLSEEDDYDLAAASLDGYKLAYVRQSLEKLEQVRKLKTVESIHEGADKVRHQIELLLFDEDEMVEIDGSEDMTELENSIKQNEANMAITDAYAAAAAEAFERQLRQMQKPYCAVYTK